MRSVVPIGLSLICCTALIRRINASANDAKKRRIGGTRRQLHHEIYYQRYHWSQQKSRSKTAIIRYAELNSALSDMHDCDFVQAFIPSNWEFEALTEDLYWLQLASSSCSTPSKKLHSAWFEFSCSFLSYRATRLIPLLRQAGQKYDGRLWDAT